MAGRRLMGAVGCGILLCALAMVTGCGPNDPGWPKRYPVSGKVLVDGKPAVRAMVTFHPKAPAPEDGKTYSPSTFTDDSGAFRLTTMEAGDGAPAGEYVVTIVANYVVKNGQDVSVPDRLKGRYEDAKKSPLRVTVREEANALEPFDLKSR